MVANYKSSNTKTYLIDKPLFSSLKISPDQFSKNWKIFRKNPYRGTEQFMIMHPGMLTGESYDKYGNKLNNGQIMKDEQNYAKKRIKQNNNYINLKLYK